MIRWAYRLARTWLVEDDRVLRGVLSAALVWVMAASVRWSWP